MAHFPTELHEPEPIPDLEGSLAVNSRAALREKGFDVWVGFDEIDLPNIRRIAGQTAVRNYCWKDETDSRFGSPEAAAKWVKKGDEQLREYGRAMFLLTNRYVEGEQRLAGYGWAGPEQPAPPEGAALEDAELLMRDLQGRTTTFAIRISEQYMGQGLAIPFTKTILAASKILYGGHRFWLETWGSNHAGPFVYGKSGWQRKLIEIPGKRRLGYDGEEVDDIRTYYTFPDDELVRTTQGPPIGAQRM
jgi:hypothetical protein